MFNLGVITVQVPALDRLMDYLEGIQQKNIDAATATITAFTARLKQSNDPLTKALKENS
jgi:hypothetical protein